MVAAPAIVVTAQSASRVLVLSAAMTIPAVLSLYYVTVTVTVTVIVSLCAGRDEMRLNGTEDG